RVCRDGGAAWPGSLLKKPVMLCRRQPTLNAGATPGLCSLPQPQAPSRAAGSFNVKSFGRRQAYESPRGRNPRATGDGYGDFELRPVSAMARPPLGGAGMDADRPLRCAFARFSRPGTRFVATLSVAIITI